MRCVEWHEGQVRLVDQRALPWELKQLDYADYRDVAQAISDRVVQGTASSAAAGAFGMALAAQQCAAADVVPLLEYVEIAAVIMKKGQRESTRLELAVDRLMRRAYATRSPSVSSIRDGLLDEAQRVADEIVQTNRALAEHGVALLRSGDTVLHHGATGGLSAVEHGTALGVIRTFYEAGRPLHVLQTEGRPDLRGTRLAAWELADMGASFDLIADATAAHYMKEGEVNGVLVGGERVASNGDTVGVPGTFMLAVLAHEHHIPFYVVAPDSNIEPGLISGDQIVPEFAPPEGMRQPTGTGPALIPDVFPVRNLALDITPARYITVIITEHGIVSPPYLPNLAAALNAHRSPPLA